MDSSEPTRSSRPFSSHNQQAAPLSFEARVLHLFNRSPRERGGLTLNQACRILLAEKSEVYTLARLGLIRYERSAGRARFNGGDVADVRASVMSLAGRLSDRLPEIETRLATLETREVRR